MLAALPYRANEQQTAVVAALARYCSPEPRPESAFILNGYAGTGKTSLTGALVRILRAHKRDVVLLAPTGRAAKVLSANAGGAQAFTIHRKIYRHMPGAAPGTYTAPLPAENRHRDAIFIVDEASMISGSDGQGSNLLEDLVMYIFAGDNNRLILIGDTAQLPPVGTALSPAMNPDVLRALGLRVSRATLTSTARQAADSGILFNATRLRRVMAKGASDTDMDIPVPKLRLQGFADIAVASGEDLPELISGAYTETPDGGGIDNTIVITRSNRRAAEFNAGIRAQVLYREEELVPGDLLIVAKNHYFSRRVPGIDFVANGDIITVEKVYGTEVRYGMRWADVRLAMPPAPWAEDGESGPSFEAKLLLDTLADPSATIPQESWNRLYYAILADNDRYGDAPVEQRLVALRTDPYWTALQVKYAYAVTCHKAQGGQWDTVFIDLSYIPDDALGLGLYRWFYTALTRARRKIYLISPPEALLSR